MAGGHTRVAVGSAATIAYFPMAATVSRMQQQKGIWGSIGEIGVYHGRFWISLALTAKVGEPLFVCDVFRKTEDNIDGSGFSPDGAAQLKTFLEHNAAFGIKESDLMLIEGSSLKLDFDLTRRANISCFRLISIDGGHTRNITASDLAFAACNLCQGGIVIVDDFYHYSWPGVQEGVHTYWSSPDVIELAPFMVAHNKLYLTTPESQPSYRDAMLGHPVWKKYLEISNPWSPLPYELNEYHIVQAEREPPAEELQELYMQEHDLPNN